MNALDNEEKLSAFLTKVDDITTALEEDVDCSIVVEETAIADREELQACGISGDKNNHKSSSHAKIKVRSPLIIEGAEFRVEISDDEEAATLNGRRLFDDSDEEIAAVMFDGIKKPRLEIVESTDEAVVVKQNIKEEDVRTNHDEPITNTNKEEDEEEVVAATVVPNDQVIIDEEEGNLQYQDIDMDLFDSEDNEILEKETEKQKQQEEKVAEKEEKIINNEDNMDTLSDIAAMQGNTADEAATTTPPKSNGKRRAGRPKQSFSKKKGGNRKSTKVIVEDVEESTEDEEVIAANDDESEEEEEEEDEEEYEIEEIIAHRVYKGKVVKYEIKWKGYPSEDNTMESANRIHDDVYDLCAAYWDSVTGIPRPSNAPVSQQKYNTSSSSSSHKKAKASSSSTPPPASSAPAQQKRKRTIEQVKREQVEQGLNQVEEEQKDINMSKKMKKNFEHVPQYMLERGYSFSASWPNAKTNWNTAMKKFSAVQLSPTDKKVRMAYIDWNNGEKTIHTLEEAHEKCPEKLINYYEERLRFV